MYGRNDHGCPVENVTVHEDEDDDGHDARARTNLGWGLDLFPLEVWHTS